MSKRHGPNPPRMPTATDPAGQWTGAHKGHAFFAFFAYAANYLIDTDHGVMVDVEATRDIGRPRLGRLERCLSGRRPALA